MTRRVISTLSLTAFLSSGMLLLAAPASADDLLCVGGDNQRKPGSYQGVCVSDIIKYDPCKLLPNLGH